MCGIDIESMDHLRRELPSLFPGPVVFRGVTYEKSTRSQRYDLRSLYRERRTGK